MFSKLAFISLLALAIGAPQHQPAAQYPAGVDPHTCPNYPVCDNTALHNPTPHWQQPQAHWQAQPQWQPQPQWQDSHNQWDHQPQQNWNAQPNPLWNAPALTGPASNHLGGGDKYPAGISPQSCPNYPYCDVNAGGHGAAAAPPLPGFTERLYPAGVSAHSCPNFPYCN